MKEIKLTKGKKTKVDDEDFEWLSKNSWCAKESGYKTEYWYACRGVFQSYCRETKKKKIKELAMSRAIWGRHNGEIPEGFKVDHINGDSLDNRLVNLQLLTHRENLKKRHDATNKLTEEQLAAKKRWRDRNRDKVRAYNKEYRKRLKNKNLS